MWGIDMNKSKFDRRRMMALLGRAGGALAALGAATHESAAAAEREAATGRSSNGRTGTAVDAS